MSTIVTRAAKGSPLTFNEVDSNFINLNTDKIQSGNTVSTLTISSATINGGSITGITDLAIADGGTGASTAANARTNLGVTATGADTAYVFRANNLSDLASASTARTNLGLGTIATVASPVGDVVGTTDTQTLTNKTINASQLVNNSITSAKMTNGGAEFGMRNRIINGAMVIDQRNAGASVTPANGAVTYTLDRYAFYVNQASKLTVQQSTTVPAGFKNSMVITSSSAYSSGSGDIFVMFQSIEGLNVSDLGWGAAGASAVTVSFWARSSLTGTHSGALSNSGNSRSYPFTFTISAANTWEYKTIAVAGDTSGTWLTTNNAGVTLKFNCGSGTSALGTANSWASADYSGVTGSVSLVGTSGATLYITGVQLEKGSTATSFDYRPYGTELALCQRYFQKVGDGGNPFAVLGVGRFSSTTNVSIRFPWSCPMRATPSGTFNSATYQFTDGTASRSVGTIGFYSTGTDGVEGDIGTSSATNGGMTQLRGNAGSPNAPYISLSAEL